MAIRRMEWFFFVDAFKLVQYTIFILPIISKHSCLAYMLSCAVLVYVCVCSISLGDRLQCYSVSLGALHI